MTIPTGQVVWNAPLLPSGVANLGDCMVPNSDGTAFVLATDAAMGTRRVEGIAITAYSGITGQIGSCQIQMAGTVDAGLFPELGPGTESWVRKTALGRLERFTPTYGGASQLVGQVGTDGRVHLMPGWNESLAAGTPAVTPLLPGGSGNQIQFRSTDGLSFQGAANVSYNVGLVMTAAGFMSFGTTPSTTGLVRFPYAGGSVLALLSVKNSSAADTPIIRTGAGDVVTFGNVGQDCSFVSTVNGFVSFGATPATAGQIRTAYNGGSGVVFWGVKDSTATDRAGITYGPGNAFTFGNSSMDSNVNGFNVTYTVASTFALTASGTVTVSAASKNAIVSDGTTLYLGTNPSLSTQHANINAYCSTAVGLGIGGNTFIYLTSNGNVQFGQPLSGADYTTNQPFRYAVSTIAVVGSTTLTAAQYNKPYIVFTGTPGATTQTFPLVSGAQWTVTNGTNGTMTIGGTSGLTITIASAGTSIIICDGTNFRRIS